MHRHFFLILLAGLALLPASVLHAADIGIIPLYVKLERERVDFAEPRFRAYVTGGTNQFGFRIPPGYHLSGDPASGTLTLANLVGNGSITFAISGPLPDDGSGLTTNGIREIVTREHPNASIAQEFWRNNAGGGGPGFDLQWKSVGQLVECKRIIYVTSPAGVLQFTATGSKTNFTALQNDLDYLIMSFQCATNGTKPKIPPLLDHI